MSLEPEDERLLASLPTDNAAAYRHYLRGRYLLAVLLGAIAGPFAYWSGSKLSAVLLTDTVPSLVMVGVEWAVAMALLLMLVGRLERDDRVATQVARQGVS